MDRLSRREVTLECEGTIFGQHDARVSEIAVEVKTVAGYEGTQVKIKHEKGILRPSAPRRNAGHPGETVAHPTVVSVPGNLFQ